MDHRRQSADSTAATRSQQRSTERRGTAEGLIRGHQGAQNPGPNRLIRRNISVEVQDGDDEDEYEEGRQTVNFYVDDSGVHSPLPPDRDWWWTRIRRWLTNAAGDFSRHVHSFIDQEDRQLPTRVGERAL